MRKVLTLLVIAGLVVAIAGCTQPPTTTQTTTPPPATTEAPATSAVSTAPPNAQELWTSELATKGYQSWQKAPGYDTPQPAKSPHGKTVQVYVNDVVASAIASGTPITAWPVGSKIVKDGFDASGQMISVNYMQKTDQGWYFAGYDAAGKITKEGIEVGPCAPCHKNRGTDEVVSVKLPS